MSKGRKLTFQCPDCEARLVIDSETGEVLFHKKKQIEPAAGKDLEELFQDLADEKAHAEDVFAREVAAHKDRDRLLDEKFREALKQAKDSPDDEPPPRPFDLD